MEVEGPPGRPAVVDGRPGRGRARLPHADRACPGHQRPRLRLRPVPDRLDPAHRDLDVRGDRGFGTLRGPAPHLLPHLRRSPRGGSGRRLLLRWSSGGACGLWRSRGDHRGHAHRRGLLTTAKRDHRAAGQHRAGGLRSGRTARPDGRPHRWLRRRAGGLADHRPHHRSALRGRPLCSALGDGRPPRPGRVLAHRPGHRAGLRHHQVDRLQHPALQPHRTFRGGHQRRRGHPGAAILASPRGSGVTRAHRSSRRLRGGGGLRPTCRRRRERTADRWPHLHGTGALPDGDRRLRCRRSPRRQAHPGHHRRELHLALPGRPQHRRGQRPRRTSTSPWAGLPPPESCWRWWPSPPGSSTG